MKAEARLILIETKLKSEGQIVAHLREHSALAGAAASVEMLKNAVPHGRYRKLAVGELRYAIHPDNSIFLLSRIGMANGQLDGIDIRIHRVDVEDPFRGRGFGLALMQALLQRAQQHSPDQNGIAYLVADDDECTQAQREQGGLRAYYAKMGFTYDETYGETDSASQYPMQARISEAIAKVRLWRLRGYAKDPAHIVEFG